MSQFDNIAPVSGTVTTPGSKPDMIQISGSSLFIQTSDKNWIRVQRLYGSTHNVEPVLGVKPDLRLLADNQSICWGDGKTYHFRLTKIGK